jgi:hypothetical protein
MTDPQAPGNDLNKLSIRGAAAAGPELLNVGRERPGPGEAEASVEDDLVRAVGPALMVMAVLVISLSAEISCPLTVTPRGGGVIPAPQQR